MLQQGDMLGDYRIVRFISRGGMGEVYEAEQINLHSRCAVKVFSPRRKEDASLDSKFKTEARLLARLQHPNIAPVHYLANDPKRKLNYFVQELGSASLNKLLEKEDAWEEKRVREIARQIASGLCAAHKQGVVHRDLKPGNIIFRESGEVMIADFGIASLFDYNLRQALHGDLTQIELTEQIDGKRLQVYGSANYIAPEQRAGEQPSPAMDIYAFGVLIYQLLTGLLPAGRWRPPSYYGVSKSWDPLVCECLERDPGKRPESMEKILEFLEAMPLKKARPHPALWLIPAAAAALLIYLAVRYLPGGKASSTGAPSAESQNRDIPDDNQLSSLAQVDERPSGDSVDSSTVLGEARGAEGVSAPGVDMETGWQPEEAGDNWATAQLKTAMMNARKQARDYEAPPDYSLSPKTMERISSSMFVMVPPGPNPALIQPWSENGKLYNPKTAAWIKEIWPSKPEQWTTGAGRVRRIREDYETEWLNVGPGYTFAGAELVFMAGAVSKATRDYAMHDARHVIFQTPVRIEKPGGHLRFECDLTGIFLMFAEPFSGRPALEVAYDQVQMPRKTELTSLRFEGRIIGNSLVDQIVDYPVLIAPTGGGAAARIELMVLYPYSQTTIMQTWARADGKRPLIIDKYGDGKLVLDEDGRIDGTLNIWSGSLEIKNTAGVGEGAILLHKDGLLRIDTSVLNAELVLETGGVLELLQPIRVMQPIRVDGQVTVRTRFDPSKQNPVRADTSTGEIDKLNFIYDPSL